MTKIKSKMRLARFLANCGVASRRGAEGLIKGGKVKIDNKIVIELATTVDPDASNIKVNDKRINKEPKVYYLLNKPKGYICSVKDPHHQQTVLSLVPRRPQVFPVGRLDKDSHGLLLLTNDGDLAYQLTHPKFNVQKTYLIKVHKDLDEGIIISLKKGIKLEEGLAKVDEVILKNKNQLIITIHQGWKRQIRRMLNKLGYEVLDLKRIAEGKIELGDLPLGEYRTIKKVDL